MVEEFRVQFDQIYMCARYGILNIRHPVQSYEKYLKQVNIYLNAYIFFCV